LPGKHEIVTRQSGYKDFSQSVLGRAGAKDVIHVSMEKDPQAQDPKVTAEVKISVRREELRFLSTAGLWGTLMSLTTWTRDVA